MYLVARDPRPNSVFTTQAKDSATEPTAKTLTSALGKRRPNSPFTRKPSSGRRGISQRAIVCSADGLVFHRIDFVDHQSRAVFKDRQNNRQSHGSFRGRHHHHEEAVNVAVHLPEL